MPKSSSKRHTSTFVPKFIKGDQVVYDGIEYFVVEADRKHHSHMCIRKRFRPYSSNAITAPIRNVIKNSEIRRKSITPGHLVRFDAMDLYQGVESYVISRIGDDIEIQPLHVRHVFTVSIFSNRIGIIDEQDTDIAGSYIPRIPSLNNVCLQARGTWNGRGCTVVDYEAIADRYLITLYNDYKWVKREEFVIDYGDKDSYDCSWIKIGELNFTYEDLFFAHLTSYTKEVMKDIDLESVKSDIWYKIWNQSINHFANMYETDLHIFMIVLWVENHDCYWKKQTNFYYSNHEETHRLDDGLIESLVSGNTVDVDLISNITRWKYSLTMSDRRRAARIERKLRSKPLFRTKLTFVDGSFKVEILQPADAKLRSCGVSKSFLYQYISKVLWHVSNKPTAPTWVESRNHIHSMSDNIDRVMTKVPLKPFQERIVYDMRSREMNQRNDILALNTKEGISFNVVSGYDWSVSLRGGILSLDTGLGKTICTLALIKQGICLYNIKPTLIVLPLTLIDQWIKELQRFTDLSYGEIHGRKKNIEDAITKDVVFTTYGTLLSNYNRDMSSSLFTGFRRVVFDESHQCKTFNSRTVEACYCVHSAFRWCLTATPFRKGSFINIHPQLKMLSIRPFQDNENYFRSIMEREDDRSKWIVNRLSQIVMRPNLTDYVHIPDPIIHEIETHHDKNNTYLYDTLYYSIRERIKKIWNEGGVYSNFQKVKSLLNTLNMCAMDPNLIPIHMWGERCLEGNFCTTSVESLTISLGTSKFDNEVKQTLNSLEDTTCCLCLETVVRPTITNCLHIFCHNCIKRSLEFKNRCPMCRKVLVENEFKEIKSQQTEEIKDGFVYCNDLYGRRIKIPQHVVEVYSKSHQSNKRSELMKIISTRNKVVVYSQFNTVLESYSKCIHSSIITGRSSRSQRNKNIEKFKTGETKVFFLSTKIADVGINLTEGDTLVFLEPGLESSVEKQALGRLKRIGQDKIIHVYNMTTKNTIEERIKRERIVYDEAITNVMTSDGSKSYKTKKKKQFFLKYIIKILDLY